MCKKKVSVIVPVYKVEKFIKKCVLSLLAQDYNNIEIILVDDGSPDDSGTIIDNLKQLDERIIIIHQKNSGVSAARNSGIKIATGEYITFVDGDGWVEANYISYFVQLLENTDCDIAMNKNNYTKKKCCIEHNSYVVDVETAIKWIYMGDIFVAVWNKMYKKKLFKENHIKFNEEIWYGEGMLFNIECLQFVDKVSIGELPIYHQTFNPDSAMRKFNLKSNFCGIKSLNLQKKYLQKNNQDIKDAWNYHRYCFNRTIIDGLVRSKSVVENRKIYNKCVFQLRKNIFLPLKMEKNFLKKLVWVCYFFFPYIMAKRRAMKYKKALKLS